MAWENGGNTLQVSSQAGFRCSWVKSAQVRWLKQSGRVCVSVCDLHQLQDALYFSSSVFKGLQSVKKLRKMPNNIRPGFKMVSLSLPPSSVWDFKAWFFSSRSGVWRAHMIFEGSDLFSFRRCEGCGVDHVVSLRSIDAACKQGSISLTHSCTQTHSRLTLRWIKVWGKTRAGSHTHTQNFGFGSDSGSTGGVNTFSCPHRCCTFVKWNIYLAYLFITIHKTCMQLIKIFITKCWFI